MTTVVPGALPVRGLVLVIVIVIVIALVSSIAPARSQDLYPTEPLKGGEPSTPSGSLIRLGRPSLRGSGPLGAVALSADGRLVAAGDDLQLHVWSARTGSELRSFAAERPRMLAFSPDGTTLATVGEHGGGARFFALGPTQEAGELPSARDAVAWSPDGKLVAVFDADGVLVFHWPGLKKKADLAEAGPVRQMSFGSSGLGWIQQDGSVKLGSVETGDILRFSMAQGTPAAIDSSARLLAHAARGGAIDIFDLKQAQSVTRLEGHPRRQVTQLAFSPRGDFLVTGDDSGDVKVWLTDGDTQLPLQTIHAHPTRIVGIAFNGSAVATIAEHDPEVRLFSALAGVPARRGHLGPVTALAYAKDGRLASAGSDGTILVWSPADRSVEATLRTPGRPLGLAFTPSGRSLAVAFKEGTTRLLDVASGREVWRADAPSDDAALAVAFFPAGDKLVVGMLKGEVVLRDARTGERATALPAGDGAARSVAVAVDGKLVAATNGILSPANETVNVFDLASAKKKPLVCTEGVRSLAFAPDGTTLVAARVHGCVELRDVRTGKLLRAFGVGLEGQLDNVAVSPDGRLIAVSVGSLVSVNSFATGDRILLGEGHRGAVNALAFAPGSHELASASEDGSIVIWNTGVSKK